MTTNTALVPFLMPRDHQRSEMAFSALFRQSDPQDIGPTMYSSAVFGDASQTITTALRNLKSPAPPSRSNEPIKTSRSLDEALFDARAAAKQLTSTVAMHLDPSWRHKLFAQLDSLHDLDEWEDGDIPLRLSSYRTFLRAICFIQPKRRPGLGLSSAGHLIAVWMAGKNRLTIEFLAYDVVKLVLSNSVDGYVERAAVTTKAERLLSALTPYQPDQWLGR